MESFWSTLKRELIHRREFPTRAEARAAIFEWIEVFYNRERPPRPRFPIPCGLREPTQLTNPCLHAHPLIVHQTGARAELGDGMQASGGRAEFPPALRG